MSTKMSANGLNLQHNCSDGIMAGTTFSDAQEDQAVRRIHRLGQQRVTHVFKLMLKNSFMQVRLLKRVEKVIPGITAHMCSSEDSDEKNTKHLVQIEGDSAEELAENLWKQIEGVKGLPPMPEWFKGVLPDRKEK
jgi:SNF2 family DNA or RNA helicase